MSWSIYQCYVIQLAGGETVTVSVRQVPFKGILILDLGE